MISDADEFLRLKFQELPREMSSRWFVNFAASGEWDLIGSQLMVVVSDFVSTNTSSLATLATIGSAYAVGYYDNSTDTWTNYTTGTVGIANFDIGKMSNGYCNWRNTNFSIHWYYFIWR